MQLPWWSWTLLSLAGFAGTALISTRLTAARVAPTTVNVYLFTAGLVAFLLYSVLTKPDLRLPAEARWWILPLALTVFASNYAVVTAYRLAPNVAYVKAVGVGEVVLVALVVAGIAWLRGRPLDLSGWKLAGMGLCFVGAVLVVLEERRSAPAEQTTVVASRQDRDR
jgi:hypothetical protein